MRLEEKLEQIRREFSEGKNALAKARIHGVISAGNASPETIELAGEIHQALGDPEAAGCYWWVINSKKPEHQDSIERFRKATAFSGYTRLRRAKVTKSFAHLEDEYESWWIEECGAEAVRQVRKYHGDYQRKRAERNSGSAESDQMPVGCRWLILVFGILAFVGFLTIFTFVREAIRTQW